jgi:hypothetical protein
MDLKQKIAQANDEAARRLMSGDPVLIDLAPAGEVIPGLTGKMITHSGPPIEWTRMCGAQQGAVIGMVLYEGWAEDAGAARALLARGEIRLEPNHHHQAVGPMAGTISPSARSGSSRTGRLESGLLPPGGAPPAIRRIQPGGRRRRAAGRPVAPRCAAWHVAASTNRFSSRRFRWATAHNRNSASSSLLPTAWRRHDRGRAPKRLPTMQYLSGHNNLFLGLAMACGKATADPARDVEYSTVVTAMCRNGTEFGIRVSGLGDTWFTAPAPAVDGLYLPGYSAADAGLDMGDSAITETVGWGAFTLGGAPGILPLVGGTFDEALRLTREMRKITTGIHSTYRLPSLGFEGTSVGIDIRKVIQLNLPPVIDTAIAHREAGHPIIGAGLTRAPMECFVKALRAFGERYQAVEVPAAAG